MTEETKESRKLGFCAAPKRKPMLFVYIKQEGESPWYHLDESKRRVIITEEAIRCYIKEVRLTPVVSDGEDKLKLDFYLEGDNQTISLRTGAADDKRGIPTIWGKNMILSILALGVEKLKMPVTIESQVIDLKDKNRKQPAANLYDYNDDRVMFDRPENAGSRDWAILLHRAMEMVAKANNATCLSQEEVLALYGFGTAPTAPATPARKVNTPVSITSRRNTELPSPSQRIRQTLIDVGLNPDDPTVTSNIDKAVAHFAPGAKDQDGMSEQQTSDVLNWIFQSTVSE